MLDPLVKESSLFMHSSSSVTVNASYTVVRSAEFTESGMVAVILRSYELVGL